MRRLRWWLGLLLFAGPLVNWLYRSYSAARAAAEMTWTWPVAYEWIFMVIGAMLMLTLAISENWIAALSRAKRAWSDSNAPLRKRVQDYKNQFGALMNTQLAKDVSDEEYNAYKAKADLLLLAAATWIDENIGDVARDQLLDRSNKSAASYSNAAHERHNNLLLDLAAIRKNLDAIKDDLR